MKGCPDAKAELEEVVAFLKHPDRFTRHACCDRTHFYICRAAQASRAHGESLQPTPVPGYHRLEPVNSLIQRLDHSLDVTSTSTPAASPLVCQLDS